MRPLEDEFGDIIQKARTGHGFTIKEVAERADIPLNQLEDMETYRHTPSKEDVATLANVVGLNATKLQVIAAGLWHPEEPASDRLSDIMIIEGSIGAYKVNGYILIDRDTHEAVAFDTANNSRRVLDSLKGGGLRLRYIFVTHCHSDHTGGLKEIYKVTGAGIGVPDGESMMELEGELKGGIFPVKDNSEFRVGSHTIRALATPGHTYGSTCYVTQDYCFSGDTIFAGSVGRAYSPEGYKALLQSVRTRIFTLKRDVRIFPGHGPVTTVGEEIAHNPFF